MKSYISYLVILVFSGTSYAGSLAETSPLIRDGKIQEAFQKLSLGLENLSGPAEDHHFALGRLSLKLGLTDRAQEHFKKSGGKGSLFKNWSKFYLGSIDRLTGQSRSAKSKLLSLAGRRQPAKLRLDARKELALAAIQRKSWREARRHLYYLERRTRGGGDYPEILWRLVEAELGSKRKWKACRYARKLYSKYPSHELIADWGIDLQKNLFFGKKLGCIATTSDQRRRLAGLQASGNSVRAKAEIGQLKTRAGSGTTVYVDLLEARFLLKEGEAARSIQLLLKHYDSQKNSYNYLMLLAKASQISGEYHAAVGAYERAHKLRPRSRHGRKALFQAAFTSYQFQDYDGAMKRFQRFQRKYRRSGLTRDVAWHIAWLKYLRGDYKGSYKKFSWILRQKRRYRRRWRSFPSDRIQYWMAMSLLRNGEVSKAGKVFAGLTGENRISYYSVLAKYRVSRIESLKLRSLAEAKSPFEENPFEESKDDEQSTVLSESSEESESEESLAKMSEESDGDEPVQEESTVEAEADDTEDEDIVSDTSFKSARLSKHFLRAKKFIEMGFDESARWELYEIERRTRKDEQLKALMYHYDLIKSHHRSAYIGEIYFRGQRLRHGMSGVKYLWDYTYPKAFEEHVEKYSKEFSVPKELTWAIMRAESRYRKDAVSPAGARGLMQLMPNTAAKIGKMIDHPLEDVSSLETPERNIQLGSRYLMRLLKKYDRSVPLAAAAYNAGPHRMNRWLHNIGYLEMDEFVDHIPFVETRNYVKKVVRNYRVYHRLHGSGEGNMPWLIGKITAKPENLDFTRENWGVID